MALIKKEFRCTNFFFDSEDPDLFLSSRWQERYTASRTYLAYRWIRALYHVGWIIYLFLDEGGLDASFSRHLYFFIYLTNLSYLMLTLLDVVWAINMTRGYFKYKKEGYLAKQMGPSLKIQWSLQNIIFMPAMVVTAIYWLSIYNPEDGFIATNVEAHIVNTATVLLDIFVSAVPIRLLHIYQPIGYLMSYILFSVIYYLAGGTQPTGEHYIYTVLDWDRPGYTCIYVTGALGASIVIYVFTWILVIIRDQIYSWSVKRGTAATFEIA